MKPKFRNLVAALSPRSSFSMIAVTFLLAGGHAVAQSGTWAATASGNWGTATNWAASTVASGSGNLADFTAVNVPTGGLTVTLDSARTIGSLSFGDTDLATAGAWTVASSALTLASPSTPVLSSSVNATISSTIAGTNGFTKEGSGTITLTADNSTGLTGGVTLKSGVLSLITGAANLQKAIGNSANTITFEGGTLTLNGSSVNDNGSTNYGPLANPLVVAAGQTGTIRSFVRGGITSTLTGGGTLNLVVRATRGDITGNWNAFTGNIVVSSQLSPTFGDFRVNGTNQFANSKVHLNPAVYMVQAFNPPNSGALTTTQSVGELSGSVGSQLAGNPVSGRFVAWSIGGLNTDSLFEGTIVNAAGAARIIKVGTGTLTVTGNNTYTGNNGTTAGTQVLGGTLAIGNGGATGSLGATNTAVSLGATLVFNRDATSISEYPGILSGAGTVIKRGAGQIDFKGVNTYTAGTIIEGGIIGINNANSLGNSSGTVTFSVGNGGVRSIAPGVVSSRFYEIDGGVTASFGAATVNDTLTIDSTIYGDGGLSVAGNGILYLAGDNTYSGSTTVTSGTLCVSNTSGSATSSGALAVNAGTLAGAGTISGSVSVASPAKIRPGAVTTSSTSVGTLSTGVLTLAGGSTIYQEFSSTSSYDKIVASGNLLTASASAGNPIIVDLRASNSVAKWITNGTYNIIEYSGSFSGDADALFEVSESSKQQGLEYTFANTGSAITLTITGVPPSQWNVDAAGAWSNAGNWLDGVPNAVSRTAIFGSVITAPRTVTLDGPHTVGSLVMNNLNSYTIGGSSTLNLATTTGNASISVLLGDHTFSCPMTLSNTLGLTFVSAADSLALMGDISGTGGLVNSYPSTVVLGGNNTFSGPVNLSNGTVEFANNSLGSGSLAIDNQTLVWSSGNTQDISNRPITMGSGIVTFDTNGNNVTLANAFGGGSSGTLTKAGAGTLSLWSDPDFTGAMTIAAGRLKLGNGGSSGVIWGDIVNNSELEVNYEDQTVFSNVISGTGSLIHSGAGDLVLNAINTFSGPTSITSPSAQITLLSSLNLQNSTLSYQDAGGSLDFGSLTAATLGGLEGNKSLALLNSLEAPTAVTLTLGGNGQNTSYSGVLSGPGSLIKTGTGITTLSGGNTYTGATTVNAGTLAISGSGSISTTTLNVAGNATMSVLGASSQLTASGLCSVNNGGTVAPVLYVANGTVNLNGGISATGNANNLYRIQVDAGTLSTTNVSLSRNALAFATEATAIGSEAQGLFVNGGTVNLSGNLDMGTTSAANSSVSALVKAGELNVAGRIVLGINSPNRWSVFQVNGGTFNSTDTTNGFIIGGPFAGQSVLSINGGTSNIQKIQFGQTGIAGSSVLRLVGGELYLGAGGMSKASASLVAEVRFAGGTIGANAAWQSEMPINVSGATATIIKPGNAVDDPFTITLDGALTGTGLGGIEIDGPGTVVMGGDHSYSGPTTVLRGTLEVKNASFSDGAAISIYSGAKLKLAFSGGDKIDSLVIGGEDKPTGVWGAPGSGAPNTDPALEGTGLLYVGVDIPVSGYDAWITSSGLTPGVNDGPNADPDNDGIENQLEFVLGGNPLASSNNILPELDASGANFVFTFKREDDSEAEIALTFQYGSDLAGWTDVAIDADGNAPVVVVAENAADPDDITITIPKGINTELFGRLRAVK